MKIFDISKDVMNAPLYEGDPAPILEFFSSQENGQKFNTSNLSFCLHTATHIDAPFHCLLNGKTVDELYLDLFAGECTVKAFFEDVMTGADAENFLPQGTKRIFIKGYGKTRLDRSAAYALSAMGVEVIGTDALTIGTDDDDFEVHRQLLLNGIVIIEGLDLSGVQSGEYRYCAFPVKISGAEAAPCRAVLFKD